MQNKFSLGFFPTPLYKLHNLSRKYRPYELYMKRDDQTGLASGGNKTRKLEYLLAEALKQGCNTVITLGAQQSNHCRQAAAACAATGLSCHLIVRGEEPSHSRTGTARRHLARPGLYRQGFLCHDRFPEKGGH